MTLFSIDRRHSRGRPKHNFLDNMNESRGRVLSKGQLFSAPLEWPHVVEQLKLMEQARGSAVGHTGLPVVLPVWGEALAARVRPGAASFRGLGGAATLADLSARIRALRRRTVVTLPAGGHHVHLTEPEAVADAFVAWANDDTEVYGALGA